MLEYALFLTTRAILQFLCNFIPFKNTRKKARNAVFEKYLSDKIITLNEVDLRLPREVLARINACDNKYFIDKNRRICVNSSCGDFSHLLKALVSSMDFPIFVARLAQVRKFIHNTRICLAQRKRRICPKFVILSERSERRNSKIHPTLSF